MLCMERRDIEKLKELYRSWLKEAFEHETQSGGEVTSFDSLMHEVKRVKGDNSFSCVKEYLKGIYLSVPFITCDIVEMSMKVISSPILVRSEEESYGPLHIEDTYGAVILCHPFCSDDWGEFDDLYWNILTECVLEGVL